MSFCRVESGLHRSRNLALIVSAICSTVASPAWAQSLIANDKSQVVDKVAADPGNALAVIVHFRGNVDGNTLAEAELHNLTDKTITAYKADITVTYADGNEFTLSLSEDLLHLVALADAFADVYFPGDGGLLGPHQTRVRKFYVPNGTGGSLPLQTKGVTVAIIYKDRTAVGDQGFINLNFTQRAQRANDMKSVIAEMEKIFLDGEVRSAASQTKNFPSAENKFRQQLDLRIKTLGHGTPAEKRYAHYLERDFYQQYSGGPLNIVQNQIENYRAQQAAYAYGSVRQEEKW